MITKQETEEIARSVQIGGYAGGAIFDRSLLQRIESRVDDALVHAAARDQWPCRVLILPSEVGLGPLVASLYRMVGWDAEFDASAGQLVAQGETRKGRSDRRYAHCVECGARCVPGESHLEHNLGWKKKVLTSDWPQIVFARYPGWDLVESIEGRDLQPPFVKLAIRRGADKPFQEIMREFDDVAVGRFYGRDFTRDGSPFVQEGDAYEAGFWFQRREDAHAFIRRYGGTAG